MSAAEETKPTTEVPATEPTTTQDETLAAAEPAAETSAPATDAKATETKPEEAAAAAAAAATESPGEDKKKDEPVEPITEGVLTYSDPKNHLKSMLSIKSKTYFWIGGEEGVPTAKLGDFLKHNKGEAGHATAAWSSQTGKGLLYFAKHKDHKDTPLGILNMTDAEAVKPLGMSELNFKIGDKKHVLAAHSTRERDGWVKGLEQAIADGKAVKTDLLEKEDYKKTLEKLSKPTTVAAAGTKAEASPKKSTDSKSVERAARDEDKKKPAKDRSQSRSKSFLNTLRGKKEEAAEKKEEVKDDAATKKEEAKETVAAKDEGEASKQDEGIESAQTDAAAVEEATAAPPVEDKKDEPKKEESKEETKPEAKKRGSIFGGGTAFFKGLRSPTHEKKESEVTPAADKPAEEAAVAKDSPAEAKPEEATPEPSKAAEDKPAEAKPAEEPINGESKTASAKTPTESKDKRRSSFFTFANFGNVKKTAEKKAEPEKKKSEEAAKEDVKPEETPKPVVAEPAKEEVKPEESTAEASGPAKPTEEAKPETKEEAKTEEKTEAKADKAEKKESTTHKVIGMLRSKSKAIRGGSKKEEKKENKTPAKVEENTEEAKVTEKTAPTAAESSEKPKEAEATKGEPSEKPTQSIGDVVPEAVTVGTPPPASTTVQATA